MVDGDDGVAGRGNRLRQVGVEEARCTEAGGKQNDGICCC